MQALLLPIGGFFLLTGGGAFLFGKGVESASEGVNQTGDALVKWAIGAALLYLMAKKAKVI